MNHHEEEQFNKTADKIILFFMAVMVLVGIKIQPAFECSEDSWWCNLASINQATIIGIILALATWGIGEFFRYLIKKYD